MNEKIWKILEHRATQMTSVAILAGTAGYLLGYVRTKAQYDDIVARLEQIERSTDEIELADEQIRARHPSVSHEHETGYTIDPIPDLGEKRSAVKKPVRVDLSYLEDVEKVEKNLPLPDQVDPVEAGQALARNIFASRHNDTAGDEWDYKTEIEARDKRAPYIIHVDEYVTNDMEYDQSTLTWYEKDEVLTDIHDTPIYNHREVVGELRFGHGSNDVNVVFVRNDSLMTEYEILRDTGSYQEIVLGEKMDAEAAEQELKHSAVPKFRRE